MAIPTRIAFDDFYKAVQILAVKKGLTCKPYKGKKASAICFEFFEQGRGIPRGVFCVHEDRKRKVIYSDDLKKACIQLKMTKKEFENFINNGFR